MNAQVAIQRGVLKGLKTLRHDFYQTGDIYGEEHGKFNTGKSI
jgi:hypothetical protein